jgi:hypothetical protein
LKDNQSGYEKMGENKMDKKPLIGVSICAVVLLVLGSLSNVVGYQSVKSTTVNESPLWPPELPDLIITRVPVHYYQHPPMQFSVLGLFCRVKNLGAPGTGGGLFGVDVDVIGEIYNFSTKTFEIYETFTGGYASSEGLGEGGIWEVQFATDYDDAGGDTHPFGIIRFRCSASVGWPIGGTEENTNNNHRIQIYYHPRYLQWIPLGHSFEFNLLSYFRYIFWQIIPHN